MNPRNQNPNMDSFEKRLQAEMDTREDVNSEINKIRSQIETLTTTHSTYSTNMQYQPQPQTRPPNPNPYTPTMTSQVQYQVRTPYPNQHTQPGMPQSSYAHTNVVPTPILPQSNQNQGYIQHLSSRLAIQEQKFQQSQKNLSELHQEFLVLRKEIADIRHTQNEDQQYPRRWNLLGHGFDDVPIAPDKPSQEFNEKFVGYVIDKLNELFPNLKNPIVYSDIDNAHIYKTKRFGPKSSKQVVIIRFVTMLRRNEIFSLKKTLKDTPISLTEHLTKSNLALYKDVQNTLGDRRKVWTSYGKILIEHKGSIKSIRSMEALHRLITPQRPHYEHYHHDDSMYPPPKQSFST